MNAECVLKPRIAARLTFGALSVLCGVAVHLVSELMSLGWNVDRHLIVSMRHLPLGALTLLALLALGAAAAGSERKRLVANAGSVPLVVQLAFAAQFAVFGLTQLGEGVPIEAGDLGLGLVAALCASVLGALFMARYADRVVAALAGLFAVFFGARTRSASLRPPRRVAAHVRVWRRRALVFAASKRPPPPALVIEPFVAINRSQENESGTIRFGVHARATRRGIEHRARARCLVYG